MEALYTLHATILRPLLTTLAQPLSKTEALYTFHQTILRPVLHTLAQPLAQLELQSLRLVGLRPETTPFRAFPLVSRNPRCRRGCPCCASYAASLVCLGFMAAVRLAQDRARGPDADGPRAVDVLMRPVTTGPSLLLAAVVMLLRQWVVLAVLNPALGRYGDDGDPCPVIYKLMFLAMAVA
ncbi:uncharacterized protein PG998_010138 [Apiospora kogelbergensis]|uniref:Uncharacterized protein n=1 Tax=Apiospora kogelbergensis TaxID=1337665 RepID=A0AAW0R9V6_9PEZI